MKEFLFIIWVYLVKGGTFSENGNVNDRDDGSNNTVADRQISTENPFFSMWRRASKCVWNVKESDVFSLCSIFNLFNFYLILLKNVFIFSMSWLLLKPKKFRVYLLLHLFIIILDLLTLCMTFRFFRFFLRLFSLLLLNSPFVCVRWGQCRWFLVISAQRKRKQREREKWRC